MEKSEFRVLIKHCFLKGKNTVQTKQWLYKCYGNLSLRGKWLGSGLVNSNDIVRAQMMLNDREGQKTLPLQKSSKKSMTVLDDPKVRVRELAEATCISIGSVVKMLHEDLSMTKLTAKWLPRLLIIDQKRQRVRNL